MEPQPGSLVLYKTQPAVVRGASEKKLTIELVDGGQVSVRQKDIAMLHPGPAARARDFPPVSGDPETAWELLDSGQTTLAELAELAFGDYTPATAWAAWGLVADGLYFSGTPEQITVHSATHVAATLAAREAKAVEERAWAAFVARAGSAAFTREDERYLADVVARALEKNETSRVLARLGLSQTREAAHAYLLEIGYWTPADNPYPARLNVPVQSPDMLLPPLPDEPRRDLTHLLTLAIDDSGSDDPDDALSLDGDRLWVHIADVAALVLPESPVDVEARGRAANLYLPEGTVRMLPYEITRQLALGLQTPSPALSFAFGLDGSAEPPLLEIVPSWINVTRLSYDEVETQLDLTPFDKLMAMADHRLAKRINDGAVEIELPEVKVRVGNDGIVSIKPLPPLRSRNLVREAMLLVGEEVGRLGLAHGIPLPFTSQDPPNEVDSPAGGVAGMFAQRRAMQRSQQRITPGRHAGLGLDVYVQTTSPLRRYLDLLAHQQLRAYLRGGTWLDVPEMTVRIGTADAASGAIRTTERLSNQHWTMVYLLQNPGWEGDGIVIENKGGRDLVLIPELAWETEVYRRKLRPLNSTVRLVVESVNLSNREARFRTVD